MKPVSRFAALENGTDKVIAKGTNLAKVIKRAEKWARKTGKTFTMMFIPDPRFKYIFAAL